MTRQASPTVRIGSATLLALAIFGCTQTNVVPVVVGEITVIPDRVNALVDDQTPLATEIRDQDGNLLPDREVAWASLDPAVVTVDFQGTLTAMGPGQTVITATADGAVGATQVTVQDRPTVRISPTAVQVQAVQGNNKSIQNVLSVENSGGGTLNGLSVRVEYEGSPGEWLDAELSASTAPANLTVTTRPAGLSVGSYSGQVIVSSSGTSATLPVSFDVAEPPPEMSLSGSSLSFSAIGGNATPSSKTVNVTNSGGGTLSGLGTQITYTGTSGWLAASLSRTQAPATLSVGPTTTNLAPGTYTASVRVTSSATSSKSVAVSFLVQDPRDFIPPDAPTRLRARENGSSSIDLDWRDRSDNETRFEVYRRLLGQPWTLIATLPADTEDYRDEGLESETWHQYRIRACNAGGCSSFSNWDSVWTDD